MKTNVIPVRFEVEQIEHVDRIQAKTGVSRSDLLRILLSAGINALAADGFKLELPLKLSVLHEVEPLKENWPDFSKAKHIIPAHPPHGHGHGHGHGRHKKGAGGTLPFAV